nr:serine-rich adhesin for platelets-like [Ipomoea batatas]
MSTEKHAPMHDFKPVECNDCALHTAEEKTNIKGNHGMFCHLNDGKGEADLFVSEEKVILDSTGLVAENDYITNGAKDSDELDSPAFMDNSLKHIENEDECSPLKDAKGVIFNFNAHKTTEEVLLESDKQDRDRLWKSPESESFMIENSGDYEVRCGISHLVGADKHIMEPEFPESIASYKESNSNDVKDICIDEGVPIVDKNLIENLNDSSFGTCVSLPSIGDKNDNLGEDVQKEMLSGDPSKIQDAKIGATNASTVKDDTESVAPDCLISSVEDNVNKESPTDTYLEDLMKLFGPKHATTGKVENDVSEKQSFGNKPLLESLCAQQHCQSSEEAILESHPTVPTNVESNKNDHSTFDLNNSKAATADESAEKISKQVLDSDAMPNNEEVISDKTSAAPASEVQCRNTVKTAENSCGHPLGPELQDARNSEDKASAKFSIGSHDQFADGEASFSSVGPMSGLITYSGLIPHSGNISLRSDSSTTSARSFAFPVLQSEWNSSPVRMAKGDRRYRKNRGWMQGLLCCRF